MKTYTDEQLVANYLKCDEKSLEVLIHRYLKPIYSFVYRYIGSEEAEDITQEVFLKMWRNLKKFNRNKKFKTWIFTIAKNTCFDWQKKKRAVPFSELEHKMGDKSFAENIPDTHLLPNELLEKIDIANFLKTALEKLSPKYLIVLLLRYNDHFTFREIAETLGESIDTIKTRHGRGIAILRKILKEK